MNPIVVFSLLFVVLFVLVAYCNHEYCMLKDLSKAKRQPYSWSRVQLAWWTVIVLSAFITILICHRNAPELRMSTVILLGISAATIGMARAIDAAEESDPSILRHQDKEGRNFVIDILSDQSGVSIHRFQTVVFNIVFGIWFIAQVIEHLVHLPQGGINYIIPNIEPNNLILLGLSSATYAALKTTENKAQTTENNVAATTAQAAQTDLEEQPVG